jgi:hypothetical protein
LSKKTEDEITGEYFWGRHVSFSRKIILYYLFFKSFFNSLFGILNFKRGKKSERARQGIFLCSTGQALTLGGGWLLYIKVRDWLLGLGF